MIVNCVVESKKPCEGDFLSKLYNNLYFLKIVFVHNWIL